VEQVDAGIERRCHQFTHFPARQHATKGDPRPQRQCRNLQAAVSQSPIFHARLPLMQTTSVRCHALTAAKQTLRDQPPGATSSTHSPSTANNAAAPQRAYRSGRRSANFAPSATTGRFASSMPAVVPTTTRYSGEYCAASTTVATWVLSPISARKKATVVATKAP